MVGREIGNFVSLGGVSPHCGGGGGVEGGGGGIGDSRLAMEREIKKTKREERWIKLVGIAKKEKESFN